jgi:hypothetical protein
MNFIQRIATGRLFFRKSEPRTKSGRIPDLVAKFTFMEETYILEKFDIGFTQEINEKVKPGGLLDKTEHPHPEKRKLVKLT